MKIIYLKPFQRLLIQHDCPFIQDEQPETDPCADNKCLNNAKCLPKSGQDGYTCQCDDMFEGKFCEIKSKLKLGNSSGSQMIKRLEGHRFEVLKGVVRKK